MISPAYEVTNVRVFYKYAPYVLALFGLLVGLTGYYLDMFLQQSYESLVWTGVALLVCVTGFTTGRLIQWLDESSHIDSLTGLWNRKYFYWRLAEERSRAVRNKTPLCVAMIDIDNFKLINDKYGHVAGDWVLSELAAVFRNTVRTTDVVVRWGGDEFAILFSGAALPQAYAVMERIRHKVEKRFSSTLVLWGDIIHFAAVQFEDPSLTIAYDSDKDEAAKVRQQILAETAKYNWLIAGAHFPFHCIGYVQANAGGYIFVPLNYPESK